MLANTPQSIGVSGHQELPIEAVRFVHGTLEDWFPDGRGVTVVCSLAAGADSIVAEYLVGIGARLHAIIPCQQYEGTFNDSSSLRRYLSLLSTASKVDALPFEEPTERAFLAAGFRVVEESDWLLAVWDGKPARGLGGTADVVRHAKRCRKNVKVLWPEGLER